MEQTNEVQTIEAPAAFFNMLEQSTPQAQPEQLGLSTHSINNDWAKYNLYQHYIGHGENKTGYKAIVKSGKVVYIGSDDYKLFPNEEMQTIADQAALQLGAVPFDKFTGSWFNRTDKHVFLTGKNEAQAHALYTFNGAYDIGGGDTINLGFAVHNSINGSMGFSIGAFTFRHACSNMVFMGFKGNSMQFDNRECLSYTYNKHTKSMEVNPEKLKAIIREVVENSQNILVQYKRYKETEIKLEVAKRLIKRLPEKYIPDYIKIEDKTKEVSLLSTPDLWQVYNDITAVIWHNEKTDYTTKQHLFNQLHSALITVPEVL